MTNGNSYSDLSRRGFREMYPFFPSLNLAVSAVVHEELTLLATQFAVVERFLFVKGYPDCSILDSSEVWL